MTEKLEMRDSVPSDLFALGTLYPEAFTDEDLLPLVRDLLRDTTVTTSIVGVIDSQLVGHVIFTKCGVVGKQTSARPKYIPELTGWLVRQQCSGHCGTASASGAFYGKAVLERQS